MENEWINAAVEELSWEEINPHNSKDKPNNEDNNDNIQDTTNGTEKSNNDHLQGWVMWYYS